MSASALAPATRHMGQKTVIEILSDDSDDSEIDMDFEGGIELNTADVDKKPPYQDGASSAGSKSSKSPSTASAASPNSTESQHPPIPELCPSQSEFDTSRPPTFPPNTSQTGITVSKPSNIISGGSSLPKSTNGPGDHPSSLSQSPIEESSSGDEDLRHILRAARKAKVQKAPGEQILPSPAPAPTSAAPSASLLSAGIKAVFGDQVERTRNFFSTDQTPARPRAKLAKPPDEGQTSSKRKASYDPFAVHILNLQPDPEGADRAKKKKKTSHEKTRDRLRKLTSSQTPLGDPQKNIRGHASTNVSSRDPNGQNVEGPGFLETRKANGSSQRRQSVVSSVPSRPRATSVDRVDTNPGQRRIDFQQLIAPKSSESNTVRPPPAPAHYQPTGTVDHNDRLQRTIINVDEDEDEVTAQDPLVNPARAIHAEKSSGGTSPRHTENLNGISGHSQSSGLPFFGRQAVASSRRRNRSCSGIIPPIIQPQRNQATQDPLQDASPDASQAQTDDLRGYIGGLSESRPAYARKEASRLSRAMKSAKTRQGYFNRVKKSTTRDKHRLQQRRPSPRPDEEARLLSAQEASTWKPSQTSSTRVASQQGTARRNHLYSQHMGTSSTQSLFRPNKSAYHQPTPEDDEDQGTRDEPAPPRYAAVVNNFKAHRTFSSLPQPSLRQRKPMNQCAYVEGDDFARPQRFSANANPSRTPRQAQLPMRSIRDADNHRLQKPHLPQLTRTVPLSIRSHKPQPQRRQVTREELDQAEAQMAVLMRDHTEKRQAMIIDELPLDFGASEPLDVRRARQNLAREKTKIGKDSQLTADNQLARKIQRRKRAIWRETRKRLSGETQEVQDEEAQKRFDVYLDRKKQELLEPRHQAFVPRARFDAAFLENGQDDDEAHEDRDVDLTARRIPASKALEALGPTASIDKYSVLLSEPHSEPNGASKFSGTKAFGQLESANYYARMILDDQAPPDTSSRSSKKKEKKQQLTHAIFGKVNGLLWGRGMLSSGHDAGNWVTVMVHKESQIIGDLDPDALRNRFVDRDILDKYARDAYDVVTINTIPKVFREGEEEERKKSEVCKRRELKRKEKREQRSKKQTEQPAVGEEEDDTPTGLEGDELVRMLANLPPPGTSHADADTDDTDADDEGSSSDTASQASDNSNASKGTLGRSSPAGNSYDLTPQNPFADIDHEYTLRGTFTRLRDANQTALDAARKMWKMRNASMYAFSVWTQKIIPYLDEEEQAMMDADDKELHLVFPGFDSVGPHTDHRPWGFTHSQVKVIKRELQGPMDLAIDFVQELHDAYKATSSLDRAVERVEQQEAEAAAGDEAGGEGQGADVVDLWGAESTDRQSSDEHDYSEEEE